MREIRIGVFGVSGKMGSEVVRAVTRAEGMTTVGGADINEPREKVGRAQVVVDFTHPDSVMANIEWCLERDISMVIGTTGFTEERLNRVRELCDQHPKAGVLIASNFSVGAVLMMKFAAIAAPFYESTEIVELHHPNKADAPSGTAHRTAEMMAAARAAAGMGPSPDATSTELEGARGADVGGVRVHSVRVTGLIAHQEVLLGTQGETLTIRHDSLDRTSFAPGVLLGVRQIVTSPGLTVGLDAFMDI